MNILTFDIEDWWVYNNYSIGHKKDYIPRINGYLDNILDLLVEKDISATFFCLGEVAKEYPEIIKKITAHKHHIGCHSFSHKFWGDAKPKEVEEDTRKALDIIENLVGEKVSAYRAPAFSIMEKNKWIFEILAKNGITQDSSIFPTTRSFGGFPNYNQKTPSVIKYNGFEIKEFPISTANILGKNIAYSGGGYFRLFPYSVIKSLIKNSDYVMTYFHIKDFDIEQKRKIESLQDEHAVIRYFKDYYGLNKNFMKFSKLLSDFNFISMEEANKIIDWRSVPVLTI